MIVEFRINTQGIKKKWIQSTLHSFYNLGCIVYMAMLCQHVSREELGFAPVPTTTGTPYVLCVYTSDCSLRVSLIACRAQEGKTFFFSCRMSP